MFGGLKGVEQDLGVFACLTAFLQPGSVTPCSYPTPVSISTLMRVLMLQSISSTTQLKTPSKHCKHEHDLSVHICNKPRYKDGLPEIRIQRSVVTKAVFPPDSESPCLPPAGRCMSQIAPTIGGGGASGLSVVVCVTESGAVRGPLAPRLLHRSE